jgi:anti-anti-sigma regulatory factor
MDVSEGDGVTTVAVAQADLEDPVEFYSAIEQLIVEEGERRISIDLSGVEMLTSLMIGTLVSVHLLAYENVVVLTLDGLHERMRALLKLIGLDKLMEAHYPGLPADGAQGAAGR